MKLESLLNSEELLNFNSNQKITDICSDSRQAQKGSLFLLLEKNTRLQEIYVHQAINNGASCVVAPKEFNSNFLSKNIPIIRVESVRKKISEVSAKFYPGQPKNILAVTGTNGKTSVTKFTEEIWKLMGIKSASIGTLGNSTQGTHGTLTTPEPVILHKQLQALAAEDYQNLVIEASSHGLDQLRVDSLEITGAAFTSFSRDHLDYHSNMDSYFNAKKRLFTQLLGASGTAVINMIDIPSRYHGFINTIKAQNIITIGNDNSMISIMHVERGKDNNIQLIVNFDSKKYIIETPFKAFFQAINSLIAACLATVNTNITITEAFHYIEKLSDVKGRLECVAKFRNNNIYIDYAHTPDALESALEAMKLITNHRLIVVFGAGGDRDKGKRSLMRDIAEKYANLIIITDDNPRFENPHSIRKQLMKQSEKFIEIADREEAITFAIENLSSDDNLLICGKGHEEYMIYGQDKLYFSDHNVVEQSMKKIEFDER